MTFIFGDSGDKFLTARELALRLTNAITSPSSTQPNPLCCASAGDRKKTAVRYSKAYATAFRRHVRIAATARNDFRRGGYNVNRAQIVHVREYLCVLSKPNIHNIRCEKFTRQLDKSKKLSH